jgi:CheY-like chemotaxis protein
MKISTQLLHQITDPALTHDERARLRCQLAKQLEEVGNYGAAREALGELWQGVGHRPVLDDLEQATAAEVLLRAGVLTGWIGSSRQIEGSQETAKNLISESITIFEALRDTEKIAEAQMELGYCYWREGAFNEARDWLHAALSKLTDRAGDLKAVTLLRSAAVEKVSNRLNDALRLFKEAAPLFEVSSNRTLKGRFHNEYAQVLRKLGEAEGRTDYIDRALIEYAASSYHFEQAGHTRYQACVENNLGFLFGTIKRFREAHEHLDRAQALFTQLKDRVHIAQVDDARARVLLAEGRVSEAEKLARCAVHALETGGEQSLYAEALITHGVILARLGRFQQAHLTLQSALVVAQNAGDPEGAGQAGLTIIEELGEHLTIDDLGYTFEQALDLLSGSKHPANKDRLLSCALRLLFLARVLPSPPTWENFSLTEALRRYEGHIIERALKDASGIVTRAAHLLGFKHHSSLINRLNARHQELLAVRTPVEPRKRSLVFLDDTATRPLSILHVEDNNLVAGALKETLETEGWTVESLRDGAAALKMIASDKHYDVLIFDNELPDTNGVDLICQTRRLIHRQQTPIIMFSASDVEKEARQAGANAFLRKPEDLNTIAETIAQLLARKPRSAN